MITTSRLSISALLAAALALPFSAPVAAQSHATRVFIYPLNDSGQRGSVTFVPRGNDTLATIDLQGVPEGAFEPAHIHVGKTCSGMNPVPTYALHSVHDGHSYTLLHVGMAQIFSGNYDINVHSSSDITHYVACGHIGR